MIAPVASLMLVAAAPPSSRAIDLLRKGGYTLVMRHASSPREAPSQDTANADNVRRERQLDVAGREGATGFGRALRTLGISVGAVWSSPTYHARETVRYAGFPAPRFVDELGDGGQSMTGVTEAQVAWLRRKVAERPAQGNTLVVTHLPNLQRAFPEWGANVVDGEVVILEAGVSGVQLIERVRIEEWSAFR